ncbi:hypothetical protein [Carboxylicivirga sp. M1479]|uniref:hypothetical protein n=1 Tax=Carboxylicivirga sp. M1479 TaxID=2594476 RepID=UPI0011784199|nr:hypothetical protein [Carboxylicivirga sp. M1479]TRX65899.1 hypothetical protein FNN09_16555 [Carboxylicivirga sp. M1479]
MKLFLLLISLGSIFQCYAGDYIRYHHEIHSIEQNTSKGDYQLSLDLYYDVFNRYDNLFYKDIHNACMCAIKVKDFEKAIECAIELVKKGYTLNDFDEEYFVELKGNQKVWKAFLKRYKNLRQQYLGSIDQDERSFYEKNYVLDQKAASIGNIAKQDSIFFILAGKLSNHLSQHGFPSIFLCKDTLNHKLHVMLRHYCGLYNRKKNDENLKQDPQYTLYADNIIKPIVDKALHDGLILPHVYMSIVSYYDDNPFGEVALKIDVDNEIIYPFIKGKQEDVECINSLRSKVGMKAIINCNDTVSLANTWYAHYPFKEVKLAMETCDTCNTFLDYMALHVSIEARVRDDYRGKNRDGFILSNNFEAMETYYQFSFMNNLKKNGINNK